MARDLFRDVTDPSISVGTKQRYTVPLSIAAHVIGLAALMVIPLMAADVLPTPQSMLAFATPPPPPPPPPAAPPSPPQVQPQHVEPINVNAAPTQPSDTIHEERPLPPNYTIGAVDPRSGVPGGLPTTGRTFGPPPPPPPPPPAEEKQYRPGGNIQEPRKIKNVPPIYPEFAKTARVQGMVIIEAVIAKDGTVKDARVLKSVALLDQSALDAVRQWRFTPTLLNGVPVEVIMTVTVNFTLGGGQ